MLGYYDIILRYFLSKMDAEKAHEFVKKIAKFKLPTRSNFDKLNIRIKNIELKNPLALAAGFDKDAEMITFLSSLGFGYITAGSVLLRPNRGNPKPRIIRYPGYKSMTNSMGLPSVGVEKFLSNLKKQRKFSRLSISIAGNTIEEIVKLYNLVADHADFIEINLSCPNTENGRLFQDKENFDKLSLELSKVKRKITFVKVSPSIGKKEIENHLDIASLCMKRNIDGITAVNTLPIKDAKLSTKQGGLSGKMLFSWMLKTVRLLYEETNGKLLINACGGIFTAEDAIKAMMNGASTFQIYTSFVYEGISLPNKILKGINQFINYNKFSNLNEVIGYKIK